MTKVYVFINISWDIYETETILGTMIETICRKFDIYRRDGFEAHFFGKRYRIRSFLFSLVSRNSPSGAVHAGFVFSPWRVDYSKPVTLPGATG